MSRRSMPGVLLLVVLLGLGGLACDRGRVKGRRPPVADAQAAPDPRRVAALSAPRLAPPTAAERAHDRGRQTQLLGVVEELQRSYRELQELARQGAAEPESREAWPARRAELLARLGKIRSRVLGVDPLGRASHGARVASRLLGTLEVQLPNAVEESWSSRPGGALRTWSADFDLIWSQLRRYVLGLKEPARKGTSP